MSPSKSVVKRLVAQGLSEEQAQEAPSLWRSEEAHQSALADTILRLTEERDKLQERVEEMSRTMDDLMRDSDEATARYANVNDLLSRSLVALRTYAPMELLDLKQRIADALKDD